MAKKYVVLRGDDKAKEREIIYQGYDQLETVRVGNSPENRPTEVYSIDENGSKVTIKISHPQTIPAVPPLRFEFDKKGLQALLEELSKK